MRLRGYGNVLGRRQRILDDGCLLRLRRWQGRQYRCRDLRGTLSLHGRWSRRRDRRLTVTSTAAFRLAVVTRARITATAIVRVQVQRQREGTFHHGCRTSILQQDNPAEVSREQQCQRNPPHAFHASCTDTQVNLQRLLVYSPQSEKVPSMSSITTSSAPLSHASRAS